MDNGARRFHKRIIRRIERRQAEKPAPQFGYCRDCEHWDGGYCDQIVTAMLGDDPRLLAIIDAPDILTDVFLQTKPEFGCVLWEKREPDAAP